MDFEKEVTDLLTQELPDCQINITNTSHQHAHGTPNNQSHFTLIVVSDLFLNKPLLQRHRQIQEILKNPINRIKALSLQTLTQDEWLSAQGALTPSPGCVNIRKPS